MAARKPEAHTPTSLGSQLDLHRPPGLARSPRHPRFHENFDAPFSEALLNASRTTLATDSSGSYPSLHTRSSVDVDTKRHTLAGPPIRKPQLQPQLRQDSWSPSEPAAVPSKVNDRIREWVKKTFVLSRRAPGRPHGHHSIAVSSTPFLTAAAAASPFPRRPRVFSGPPPVASPRRRDD